MSKNSLEIFFKVPSAWLEESIQEISDSLSLKAVAQEPEDAAYFIFDEQGLSFSDPDLGVIHLDFVEDHIRYQRKGHRGKSELIVKALGLEKKTDLMVDATVGLGADSLFIVQLGYSVIGFERSPLVYLLLKDALRRWEDNKSERSGSFKVIFGDAATGISQIQNDIRAIYVDPMFPEKKKSALPRKEMQIFKKWVGEDADSQALLQAALQSRAERVVVKRPLKAEALAPGVVHSFKGTTVRYDLYSPRKGE